MRIFDQLKEKIELDCLFRPSSTIVLAVSGGADSMALLYLASVIAPKLDLSIIVAHVNHGFREQESAKEAELVKQYCHTLDVQFEMIELEMPKYLEAHQQNSQSASRERRYQFFYDVAMGNGASAIVLAHHADDQAETVLMHVLRGSGLTGLSGMSIKRVEKNVELIRPLLRIRKDELMLLCQQEQIPYLEDSSNQSRDYFRNELRLDVIPYLERFNPKLVTSLNRLAEISAEEDRWLAEQVQNIFATIVKRQGLSCVVDCSKLSQLAVALQRRLIKLILSYLSQDATMISFEGIERIRAIASEHSKSTQRIDVGSGIACVREYEVLRFVHIKQYQLSLTPTVSLFEHIDQLPITIQYGKWSVYVSMITSELPPQLSSKYEAVFDSESLVLPLTIRNRISGDRMHVLGLKGTKKVQDMFVDAKIPVLERDQYPLFVDGEDHVLWIPGIRRSTNALVQDKSRSFIYIQCVHSNHPMLDR